MLNRSMSAPTMIGDTMAPNSDKDTTLPINELLFSSRVTSPSCE